MSCDLGIPEFSADGVVYLLDLPVGLGSGYVSVVYAKFGECVSESVRDELVASAGRYCFEGPFVVTLFG